MEKLTEKELEQDDIIEQILAGKYKKYGPGHSKKCYYLLHQARQIIIGQGDLYHLTTPNPKLPELDTMDQMLSLARINADRYFESASEKIIEFLLRKENWGNFFSKENKPLIKNIRHASWKLITHLNHHGLFETWILAKKIYKTKGMFSANIQNNYLDLETSALFFEMVRIFNLKQPFVDN